MNDFNNILSDKEIHDLLKQRLLETDLEDALNQKLIDMETQLAFSNDLLMMPDLDKEKELLQKLAKKTGFGPMGKWLYTGLSCAVIATSVLLYNLNKDTETKISEPVFIRAEAKAIIQPSEPAQNISRASSPAAAKNAVDPPTPPAKQTVIASADTIAVQEALKEIAPLPALPERKPILNFVGASGIYKSFTKLVNDTGGISIDTIFKGIKRVVIDGSFCDVHVKTHNENHVSLNGNMKFEFKGLVLRKPEYRLHYTQKDSVLTVWIENLQKSSILIAGSAMYSGYLNFVVPKQTALVVKNASGNVYADGLEGPACSLGSNYGNIQAENMKNKLNIQSSSGHIRLNHLEGEVTCKASYGDIDAKQLTGDLKISSSSGHIHVSSLKGNLGLACSYGNVDLQDIGGNVFVSSSSGNVSADNVTANKINISCNYGNVKICNTTGSITIKSSSGKVNLKHITGNITAHAGYGDMELNDITGDLVLASSSGDIEITKLVGGMFIASNYGDVNAADCISQVNIKSASGNIKGKNIQLVKDLYMSANYGDIHMNLTNDLSELSFDLSAGSGDIRLDKNGVRSSGKQGKLVMKNGDILVKSVSSSGNQTFD